MARLRAWPDQLPNRPPPQGDRTSFPAIRIRNITTRTASKAPGVPVVNTSCELAVFYRQTVETPPGAIIGPANGIMAQQKQNAPCDDEASREGCFRGANDRSARCQAMAVLPLTPPQPPARFSSASSTGADARRAISPIRFDIPAIRTVGPPGTAPVSPSSTPPCPAPKNGERLKF